MLTGTKNTLRIPSPQGAYPSLLQLQTVLVAAESESPAQPPRMDTNEQLALQLIARMRANYKKELPFLDADVPNPLGFSVNLHIEGIHA